MNIVKKKAAPKPKRPFDNLETYSRTIPYWKKCKADYVKNRETMGESEALEAALVSAVTAIIKGQP